MAELAAGAIVYETVETAAQIGVGAYMVAKVGRQLTIVRTTH